MSAPPFPDIAPWPPTRYTPPLSPAFPSAFDAWAPVFAVLWPTAFGHALEPWQIAAIRAMLEVYPEGHPRAGQLRFRQAVISLARQNGKTEIAAALVVWRLLSKQRALVIGIAHSAEQAGIVYRRTFDAIHGNPELAAEFAALTDTRGIRTTAGGRYEVKASKSASLQGLPLDLGLVDEVHLLKGALWADLLNGTGSRPDCIVVGITTAGDAESALLTDLYRLGEQAIEDGADARFGFWAWEAPEARVPDDDNTLGRWLAMASPAIASGRVDLGNTIADVRSQPEPDVIRYRLNRFLSSARAPYIRADMWLGAVRREGDVWPKHLRPVFSVDASPGLGFASIVATVRDADGVTHSEIAASLRNPTLERLLEACLTLAARSPLTFAVEGYGLRRLGEELRRRGLPVMIASKADAISAASLLYRLIATGKFRHAGDALLNQQMPRAVRKAVGDTFRISRVDSSVEIDAVGATALGALAVEVTPTNDTVQVF